MKLKKSSKKSELKIKLLLSNNMKNKISIVTPCFNEEKDIEFKKLINKYIEVSGKTIKIVDNKVNKIKGKIIVWGGLVPWHKNY